ncbi:hypothetical protein B0H11DRAFT_2304548 [Mycena galericulata]|nr:hypothetical protein B0H11DRAFT_2304548 [Mycena galericulata]
MLMFVPRLTSTTPTTPASALWGLTLAGDRLRPAPPHVHCRDSPPPPPRDRCNSTQKNIRAIQGTRLDIFWHLVGTICRPPASLKGRPRPCVLVIPRKLTGLARVSHQNKLTFGTFTRYEYEPVGGECVVIDAGINIAHVEFQGQDNPRERPKYGVAKAANVIAVKGNDNRDACSYSPAAAEKAVTVGASTLGDERAYFSNYGPCVDVFAPG